MIGGVMVGLIASNALPESAPIKVGIARAAH